jgi:3-methyladenine DNA glycosylase AlkC
MGEPFKNLIGPAQVDWLAERFAAAWGRFPAAEFKKRARKGLAELELKARARHLADALEATLPSKSAEAFRVMLAMLEQAPAGDSGFRYLAVSEWLERHGPREVELALRANHELTQRFTSEFCIRTLILAAPERTLRELTKWAGDESEHVRRLVSEGTRPRLPWGRQLPPFIADPSPVLPLLERLKDDPSEYVRRSVANNLNDIAKDHPEVVLKVAKNWLEGATPQRTKLVEHGLRTLLKRGDERALKLIGAHGADSLRVSGSLSPKRVKLGERVTFIAKVRNEGDEVLHAVLEARVHFVKVRGTSVKPFRLARVDLDPGQEVEISRSLELKHRTIRRLFSGVHEVELQVNGARSPMGRFRLDV